jgi:hypothetical protein
MRFLSGIEWFELQPRMQDNLRLVLDRTTPECIMLRRTKLFRDLQRRPTAAGTQDVQSIH